MQYQQFNFKYSLILLAFNSKNKILLIFPKLSIEVFILKFK